MQTQRIPNKLLIAGVSLLLLASPSLGGTDGQSNAANKTSAAGSTIQFVGPAAEAIILETTIKTSPPQDLIFAVTLECALWTTVATIGNEASEAQATVNIKVLFDGIEVPVSGDDADGSVVFCDRLHRQTVTDLDDDDARIEQYLATRTANAFNWIMADVGGGVHTIQVVADLVTRTVGEEALAEAAVGHRTLIVEPTHMAQGATIDDGVSGADASAESAAASSDGGSAGFELADLWPF